MAKNGYFREYIIIDIKTKRLNAERVHYWVISGLQIILTIGLLLAIKERHWQDIFTITCIILLMLAPSKIGFRYHVQIPVEFELMAILFVFASYFLVNYMVTTRVIGGGTLPYTPLRDCY